MVYTNWFKPDKLGAWDLQKNPIGARPPPKKNKIRFWMQYLQLLCLGIWLDPCPFFLASSYYYDLEKTQSVLDPHRKKNSISG